MKLTTVIATIASLAITASADGCTETYEVQPGDFCSLIAMKNNISTDDLLALNPVIAARSCHAIHGEKLCVKGDIASISNTTTNAAESSKRKRLNVESTKEVTLEARGAGVPSWQGPQSGIGSWYQTSTNADYTNGHSWCGYGYYDDTPGFAPDVSRMLSDYGGDYYSAAKAYCGLEAKVTAPNGNVRYLYLVDGFDPRYVRSYGSIDIIYNAFNYLQGWWTSNKNDVFHPVQWEFTGKRSAQYSFGGSGY